MPYQHFLGRLETIAHSVPQPLLGCGERTPTSGKAHKGKGRECKEKWKRKKK